MQLKPHKQHQKENSGNVQKMLKKNNHFSTNEQIEKLTNLATQEATGAEQLKKNNNQNKQMMQSNAQAKSKSTEENKNPKETFERNIGQTENSSKILKEKAETTNSHNKKYKKPTKESTKSEDNIHTENEARKLEKGRKQKKGKQK